MTKKLFEKRDFKCFVSHIFLDNASLRCFFHRTALHSSNSYRQKKTITKKITIVQHEIPTWFLLFVSRGTPLHHHQGIYGQKLSPPKQCHFRSRRVQKVWISRIVEWMKKKEYFDKCLMMRLLTNVKSRQMHWVE